MRILLLSWLFLIPLLQVLPGNNFFAVYGQCLNDQKLLLLQFKDNLNTTNSTKLVRWNNNQDCCSWDGVKCDSSGHVIRLDLDSQMISGGFENSSSLFSLQHLESLNMAYNSFYLTPIPTGFHKLSKLNYLNLSNAGFIGQIPIDIGRMKRLVILDLSTRFPGIQPLKLESPNLGTLLQNLTELRELYLDGVNISAHGTEWCNALSSLSNLSVLSLSSCYLSGPIDTSLSELRSLSVCKLDSNNLSTTVPDFFANFSNLTVLSLSSCHLRGQFPQKIFQVPTLRTLDLSNNFITGSLPQFPQNGSFRTIVLSHTNFSGSLPDSIDNLLFLSFIDLSNCNFSGPVPYTMRNLKELIFLDFSWNNFNGPIPLFRMSGKLEYLDLSHNNLTGPISSSHFEGLTQIANINLAYNSLNGSIPPSLFALPALKKLQLSNNQFNQLDEFPNASTSLLDTLDLSSNQLNGSVPKSLFELESLSVLSLSANYFNGTVQLEMVKRLTNLTRLELSYNHLTVDGKSSNSTLSSLPQLTALKLAACNLQDFPDLKNQSKMVHLDLSDNQIEGVIPNWIWKVGNGTLSYLNISYNRLVDLQKPYRFLSSLAVLDLHSNRLQGQVPSPPLAATYVDYSSNNFTNTIPSDIGESLAFVYFFSLANNNLTGAIPKSICNAIYLQVLDLSNNFLTGSVPECLLQNMEALGVLNLGKNRLNGAIPDKFPVNCVLKTIDLSRNLIEGQIPGSLVNCTLLEVLNVGTNRIEDKFPCMLKKLSSLRALVLRSNEFHGDLHCAGADENWPNLQIIDIASNKFGGNLSARCFLTWKRMTKDDENWHSEQNHLRLEFLTLSHLYYVDTVTVTMKGLELQLQKILRVFTSIDFSCNKFEGSIPEAVGDLKALYVLNLSHNALTGTIPKTIGSLTQLESLDLSKNQLTARIPYELASLTFLSFLNLSCNKLFGSIPAGRQLQTFTESSFLGNTGLCGFPLNTSCKNNESVPNSMPPSAHTNSAVQAEFDWQFIFTGLGFGVGAAIILAPLIVCKEVREWCDAQLEKFFLLIFPTHRFSYTRYDDGKVEAAEKFEDDFTEDSDEEEYEAENEVFRGRYCVFCTKLDVHRKKALHNPKCNCHNSPLFFPSPTSSSSLLALYHHNF